MLNKKITLFEENITSGHFKIYNELYNKYWKTKNNTKYKPLIFDFTFNYNTLSYIQKYTTPFFNKKLSYNVSSKNIDNILNQKKKMSILKYKFKNIFTIQLLETFHETKIIQYLKNMSKKNLNILEINNRSSNTLLETLFYSNKKYKLKKNINYNLTIFTKYNILKINKLLLNEDVNFIKNTINGNLDINNCYFDLNYIMQNKKYDIIQNNIRPFMKEFVKIYYPELNELSSIQINFLTFLLSLIQLNKGGIFILYPGTITTKPVADILILGKKYFKEVIPYQSKLKKWQYSGNLVIFKNFIGISKKNLNELINIAKKLLKNDPHSLGFTINNEKLRKKYGLLKPKNPKYKYINKIINLNVTSPQYNFIRDFNKKLYLKKTLYLEKLLTYQKLYYNSNKTIKQIENSIPKLVKEKQLVKSIIYAKQFDLDTVIDDQGTFNSDFGKLVLKDLYTNHEPIKTVFVKVFTIMDLYKQKLITELERINKEFEFSNYILKSREIPKMIMAKHKSLFHLVKYNKNIESLNNYVEKNYTKYPVSNDWLALQELIKTFKIINIKSKKVKTFHLYLNKGTTIKSICYSLKKESIKNFDWYGHTPLDIIKNKFQLMSKYNERWFYGKDMTGNIMNVENLKSYKQICKNIKLLTANAHKKKTDKDYNKIILSEFAFMFYNLPYGSNFVIKLYLPLTQPLIVNLIYLMFKYYKNIYFYKPLSDFYSDNFYIIGLGYYGIPEKITNKILNLLKKYNDSTMQKTVIKVKYPNGFTFQILDIIEKFIKNYVFNINTQLYYLDNEQYIPKEHYKEVKKVIKLKNETWVNKFLTK